VLPFQDSINGNRVDRSDPPSEKPTPVHEVADTHDTLRKRLVGLPALGVDEIDHTGSAPASFVFTARLTSTSNIAARTRGVAALFP
jgi:hypothetical protein